ncbi:hypothetical protein MUP32_05885 [Candidatus Microgenomates bacterium]|nr:hypothetical protein [Candidatus Microgenomates bacterium]
MANTSPDTLQSFETRQFAAVGEQVKKIYIDWLTDALTTCACYQHPYGQLIPSGYTGEGTVILDKLGEKLTEKGAQVDFVDFRDEKQVVAECAKLIKQLQADFPRVSPDELSGFTAEPMDEKTLSNPVIAVKGFTTLLAISNTAGPNRQQAQELIKQIQDLYSPEDTRRKPVLIVDSDENDVQVDFDKNKPKPFPHKLPFGKLEAVAPAASTLAAKIFTIMNRYLEPGYNENPQLVILSISPEYAKLADMTVEVLKEEKIINPWFIEGERIRLASDLSSIRDEAVEKKANNINTIFGYSYLDPVMISNLEQLPSLGVHALVLTDNNLNPDLNRLLEIPGVVKYSLD